MELELSEEAPSSQEGTEEEPSAQEGGWGGSGDGSGGGTEIQFGSAGGLPELPSLEESTVMFLHVFKCAGSTTRWAGSVVMLLSVVVMHYTIVVSVPACHVC